VQLWAHDLSLSRKRPVLAVIQVGGASAHSATATRTLRLALKNKVAATVVPESRIALRRLYGYMVDGCEPRLLTVDVNVVGGSVCMFKENWARSYRRAASCLGHNAIRVGAQ
jgi:hypothetical protein